MGKGSTSTLFLYVHTEISEDNQSINQTNYFVVLDYSAEYE